MWVFPNVFPPFFLFCCLYGKMKERGGLRISTLQLHLSDPIRFNTCVWLPLVDNYG